MRRLGDDLAADNQGPVLAEMYDSFMERQTEYHEETRVHYNAEKERIRGELEACSDRVDELIPVGDLYQVGTVGSDPSTGCVSALSSPFPQFDDPCSRRVSICTQASLAIDLGAQKSGFLLKQSTVRFAVPWLS